MATKKQAKQRALEPSPDDEDPRPGILRAAPPPLRDKLKSIERALAAEWTRSLLARYDLAAEIEEIDDDVTKARGKRYGTEAVQMLGRYFGWERGFIYGSLTFARSYTRKEIEAAAEMRLPNGRPLTISHLRSLCDVPDREQRQKLLQRVVSEGWTAERLADHIDQQKSLPAPGQNADHQVKAPDQRGRPLAIPRTFEAVLLQQKRSAQDFVERATKVWTRAEHSLSSKAVELGPDEITEEKVRAAKELAETLEALAREALERAQEARAVYERLKGILDRQKQGK